jgi:uncharacterized protein YdaU (DUF1376 family)
MKESYYFSHDYHARADENIIRLLRINKVEGYGVYWMIVEMLYEGGGSIPKDYELISYEVRTDSERIRSVCEDFDLFYFKDGRICSKSVDRRLAERENRSFKAKESAKKRWNNNDNNAKAMRTHSERIADLCEGNAIKERKGKEIKGKEIEIPEWLDIDAWKQFIEMRNKIKKPMTDTAKRMAISDLQKLKDQGQNIKRVLEQSVYKCWQSLYPVRSDFGNVGKTPEQLEREHDQRLRAEHEAQRTK